MTGFGDARDLNDRMTALVEIRSVNNRYLKVVTRCPEVYSALEGDVERVVRESISRGTVTVNIRVDRVHTAEDFALNPVALKSYWSQLQAAASELHAPPPADLGSLLPLPGVVVDHADRTNDVRTDGEVLLGLLRQALDKLHAFRTLEGRSMERELAGLVAEIARRLDEVTALAPQVVDEYRGRVLERVKQILAESGVEVTPTDLIREVSIFSDRSDVNEELARLRSHLEQFTAFLREPASAGRKLDFLTQEMFREVNTIGSKANNVAIAHRVVEMKAGVEKIREILQNVE
jgi:uncharacterized protein (TIGR00255 family)